MYEYKAKIVRWVDGDTVIADIDLGFEIWLKDQRLRLNGVDTPELRPPYADFVIDDKGTIDEAARNAEMEAAMLATEFCEEFADAGQIVTIRSYDSGKGKYGRWLVDIIRNGQVLNDLLIENGLAKKY